MLDVVANHVAPVHNDFSAIAPFNDSRHYHGCAQGCDENCGIPPAAYGADEASPSARLLVETCRLQGLPDLNQSVPFVRQALLGWLQDTLGKYRFDGIRVDTVKHVSTVRSSRGSGLGARCRGVWLQRMLRQGASSARGWRGHGRHWHG